MSIGGCCAGNCWFEVVFCCEAVLWLLCQDVATGGVALSDAEDLFRDLFGLAAQSRLPGLVASGNNRTEGR